MANRTAHEISRPRPSRGIRRHGLALALTCAALLGAFTTSTVRVSSAPLPVLILYDSAGQWGYLGGEYALMLQNLLGHFNVAVTSEPANAYSAGQLNNYGVTFYIGSTYAEPSYYPSGSQQYTNYFAFVQDVATTTKPVVWLDHNLWEMAWSWNPAWGPGFSNKFGINYVGVDSTSQYNRVAYKNTELLKGVVWWANPGADLAGCTAETPFYLNGPYDCGTEMNVVAITNSTLAQSRANAYSTATGAQAPYVTHAANLWMVGDIPFAYLSEEDRYLAIADLLHDMLGINHAVNHRGLVRLEDVSAWTPVTDLNNVVNVLNAHGAPFSVATIPHYLDPTGFYNGGVPVDLPIAGSQVGQKLHTWQRQGRADITQEGTTHQYDNTPNPYDEVSGDDAEFYRITQNADLSLTFQGPVPVDSASWATSRIATGQSQLANAGLTSFSWLAPHYVASATDYSAIRSNYQIHYGRVIYFPPGVPAGSFAGQFYPFTIKVDAYGYHVLPENIAYVEPAPNPGFRPLCPNDLIRFATKALVVRDGFASFFYDPTIVPSPSDDCGGGNYLDQTMTGIHNLGYTFVAGHSVTY